MVKRRTGAEGEAARRAAARERRGGAEGEAARRAVVREREEHLAWLLGEPPPIEAAPIEPPPIELARIEPPPIELARIEPPPIEPPLVALRARLIENASRRAEGREASHGEVVRAVRREQRRPRRPVCEVALERVAQATRAVAYREAQVEGVRRYRDGQVALLRELGVSWEQIAVAAGVSRQALVKRQGGIDLLKEYFPC